MKIEILEINGIRIAEIKSDNIILKDTQDALDLMADCSNQGSGKIVLHEKNIIPGFF